MRLAYYGGSISPNIVKTPEGYLICKNVPIGRTGSMDYLAEEMGLKGSPGQVVSVYRTEDEVFDTATLASFEGKPVTNGHPPDDVEPSNWAHYTKGHVQNVRRGTGADADKIVADLFITDPQLIAEIENKLKREVSSGYACVYAASDSGDYYQKQIRGNHVAVVDEGRAGGSVCIKDTAPKVVLKNQPLERRKPLMSKATNHLSNILSMFGSRARDAKSTDELEDMAKDTAKMIGDMVSAEGSEPDAKGSGDKKAKDEAFAGETDLLACIKELTAAVKGIGRDADTPGYFTPGKGGGMEGKDKRACDVDERTQEDRDDEDRALGKAIKELLAKRKGADTKARDEDERLEDVKEDEDRTLGKVLEELLSQHKAKNSGDEDDAITAMIEELTGKDVDNDGDGAADEDLAAQEEALTVNAETMDTDNSELEAAARDTAIAILKNARPAIAKIKSPTERKRVTDALLRSVKDQLGVGKGSNMAGIMNATAKAAQQRATDSAKRPGSFDLDAQQKAYDKFNPHLKKEVK